MDLKQEILKKSSIVESFVEVPGQKSIKNSKMYWTKRMNKLFKVNTTFNIQNNRERREKKSPYLDFFNEEIEKIKRSG